MEAKQLFEELDLIQELGAPVVLATFNGQPVRIVKIRGEFDWHKHEDSDELLLVLNGCLRVHMRDLSVSVGKNELFVVPNNVEHMTVAAEEVQVLFIRP